MSSLDLISRLRARGIRISAQDGELELNAPKGVVDAELCDEIVQHKVELLRLLSWSRRSVRATDARLEPISRDQKLPLSWAQQRIWFLDELEPGGSAYNISWTVRLRGRLQQDTLQSALNDVVRRHETLRTCFPAKDGVPRQCIASAARVDIAFENIGNVADEKLRARMGQLAAGSFELATGPLLRMSLLGLSETEHILLVVIHHIVADGASMRILFRELAACYEGRLVNEPARLPELPVQYADYSVWQRNWLDGAELERQGEYWLKHLSGSPPLLELPWDRPRAAAMRYRGASVLRVLPASLATDLRALGREHGCTLFMTMLAAFYVLLMRYSGREDLVVGTPLGGRSRTSLEGLIGFFINTVVLRTDLSGDPDFVELLGRVRDVSLEAHANQDLPFEKLVEMLQPQRELSYSPVFQVMFDLQEEPRWKLPVRNLEVIPEVVFSSRTSSFDLTLSIRQAENGLDAMFEYDTDLFDEASIERLARHYETLLEAVASDADSPLSRLPLVPPAEQRALVQLWNTSAIDRPAEQSLVDLFAAQVEKTPQATAIVDGARTWSYAELHTRANALARELASRGVCANVPVALCARRSAESFAGILAILQAGGCVVPLDPAYPRDRLRFMLADCGAELLLFDPPDEELASDLLCDSVQGIALTPALFLSNDNIAFASHAMPDDLAYILYTSGTSGRPKGVELEHRGFVNYICQLRDKTGISAEDRVLQFASLSFDIAVEECWSALLNGGALVLRDASMSQSLQDFVTGCFEHNISWMSLPTAWWHELCAGMQRGEVHLPQCLRTVVIGGEKAELESFRQWHRHAPGIRLFNTYGPTEASIVAAWCELTHLDADFCTELPLGEPVSNTQVWVMDEHMQPVPVGLPGELCIAGPGIARGYRNEEMLTQERFITVTFADGTAERLYRTGDRARYLANGKLVFLGRADSQFKLRGHRVEPAEIEAGLNALPQVDRSAVVLQGAGSGAHLVAYVTGPESAKGLRDALRSGLPDYMVPAVFVVLEQLPFTANGKLDRNALPEPVDTRSENSNFCPPATPTEVQLASIWSEVLNIRNVASTDDFFALGGHSLIATRVMARIRSRLATAVPLRAIFDNPTIATLAREIDAHKGRLADLPIRQRKRSNELLPLSWSQQRLWMLDRLQPGNTAYNLYSSHEIRGELRLECLQLALNDLFKRHESLRTVFAEHQGEPVQLVQTARPVLLQQVCLTRADERSVQDNLQALVDVPFDLQAGPLLRAHVLSLPDDKGESRSVLLLLMHHIISDGWSMNILFRELETAYTAHFQGRPLQRASLEVQYADYALWQRDLLAAGRLSIQELYWCNKLADAPPVLELPADRERPAVQTYNGAWETRQFSRSLIERLQLLATEQGCTLFMVLLSGFKSLLARYCGCSDIVVGTPVAGRVRTELEPLIGMFLNTLVLRTEIGANPSFVAVLEAVRDVTLEAFDNQDLPFERLLEIIQPERSASYTPVFQVMFNFHTERGDNLKLPGLSITTLPLERGAAKFDLSVALAENQDGLQAGFEYNTDLFDAETIARLLEGFECLLEAMADRPEQVVADVILSDGSAVEALAESGGAETPTDWNCDTISERFEQMVAKYSHRMAVITPEQQWTYGQLAANVHRVARVLRSGGVLPGERVALLLGHDATMLAGVLGALYSGCVYVPLDRNAPPARLNRMLAKARVETVLTDTRGCTQAALLAGVRRCINIDVDVCASAVAEPLPNIAEVIAPAEVAYVLFTSGSTGEPKGVIQTHENVLHHVATYSAALGIVCEDRLTLLSGYGFDAAVMDIFGALLNGACLYPLDLTAAAMPNSAAVVLGQVSILHATPTVFRYLMSDMTDAQATRRIRRVVLGGEEVLLKDFELFKKICGPNAIFINGFGPSESTLAAQFFAAASTRLPGRVVPIGSAVADTELALLDEAGDVAGFSGEIAICSRYVSAGYLNQAELTAERFQRMDDGRVLYRTGDRARRLPNGQLVYAGRVDGQFKIRGYRIEPGEIEAAMSALPEVIQAAVFVQEDRLLACYTGFADAAVLRQHLKSVLPVYMQPEVLSLVSELPLLSNGKVDRQKLEKLELAAGLEQEYAEPSGAVEESLAVIWCELLGLDRVGRNDDLFSLGGHSLLATRILSRIRDEFGQTVSLRQLFSEPTIAQLATLLRVVPRDGAEPVLSRRLVEGSIVPLSSAQQRLWFLDQLEPGSPAYHLHWAARLHGTPDLEALQAALSNLLVRHESLRTSFADHSDEPVQVISADAGIEVQSDLLSGASNELVNARLLELIRRPFNLQDAPLLRVHLLQISESESVLLLVMHHIVSDGWSMGVLFRELGEFYAANIDRRPVRLPALALQYADYAVWQRECLSGDKLAQQQKYWLKQLADMPPLLELPLDHAHPPVQRYRGAWVTRKFNQELLDRLRRRGAESGATLFMVLLAAFKALVLRHTGREDIVIGAPVAGRSRTELEGLIGFFLNTLVLRTRVDADGSFTELLQRVKRTTLNAYDHQELPFEQLLELLQPARSTAHSPLVQVTFNLHNEPHESLQLADIVAENLHVDRGTSKFDLAVAVVEGQQGLQVGFEYNTDLFEPDSVDALLRHYGEILMQVAESPEQLISALRLSATELPVEIPGDFRAFASTDIDMHIADRFEAAAAEFGSRPAVRVDGTEVSYAELNRYSDSVAALLQAEVGGVGARVGLLLGHDAGMVAGVLGALKAGHVYVPLDPTAPPARIRAVATEAGVAHVLVDPLYAELLNHAIDDSITAVLLPSLGERTRRPQRVPRAPDDLAYLLFTSGTTGVPKGVVQTHRNVLHHTRVYTNALHISHEDHLTLFSGFGFDAAVMDIFGALLNGACLHPLELRAEGYPGEVLDHMAEAAVTVLHATPTVFRFLMRSKVCRHELQSVRAVVLGGEAVQVSDFELFCKQFTPPAIFVNGLGPSESTTAAQFFANHNTRLRGSVVPVGKAVEGTELLLLDAQGRQTGMVGELAIRSPFVAKGYWGQPELTAERFVVDTEKPGARIYRTGDQVRRLPDGSLVFLGRIDKQVKLRGHRIEPSEIEAVLARQAGVEKVVVILSEASGAPELLAYYEGNAAAHELHRALKAVLPTYMVPAAFVAVRTLSFKANGKLDVEALPVPQRARDSAAPIVAPRTSAEKQLVKIWSDVLGVPEIGVHDDFFELGGHSLLAAQLAARVNESMQVAVPLRRLFDGPTVAQVAEHVEALQWAMNGAAKD